MLRKQFLTSVACLLAIVPALPADSKPAKWTRVYTERTHLCQRRDSVDINSISKERNNLLAWISSATFCMEESTGKMTEGSKSVTQIAVDCKRSAYLIRDDKIYIDGKFDQSATDMIAIRNSGGIWSKWQLASDWKQMSRVVKFICSRR